VDRPHRRKVKAEVMRMHHHKSAWDRVCAMLSDNADLPHSYWWEFMFERYAITHASAVRRQADNRKDVDSLMRFIMDVRKGAAALTKTWWVDTLWSPSHAIERYEAERQWREHFGGDVRDHLDPAIPKADAADLENAADVEAFVSLFAHDYDSRQPVHPNRAFVGRDQVRANWSAVFLSVPDFRAGLVATAVDANTLWSE
jgi:hypothetical protein